MEATVQPVPLEDGLGTDSGTGQPSPPGDRTSACTGASNSSAHLFQDLEWNFGSNCSQLPELA